MNRVSKKIKYLSFWAVSSSIFILLAVMMTGCGQQAQQIYNSKPQPTGIIVRGTICKWTNSGFNNGSSIVNHVQNPIAGAYVTLDGNGITMTTTTDSNGEYRFIGIPDGNYTINASKEGYMTAVAPQTIVIKSNSRSSENGTVYTVPQFTWFDEWTWIKAYDPTPGAVISNNQVFKVTFATPMDVSTVRFRLVPQGVRTYSSIGDTVGVSLAWSADEKTVTITPNGSLSSNEVYRLALDYSNGGGKYYPLDKRGVALFVSSNSSYTECLLPYSDYRTVSGQLPLAPSNLMATINGKQTSEVDFADVITAANLIQLNWVPAPSGSITGYKIYAAREGSVLNYTPLESDSASNTSTSNNYFTSNISKVIKAIYGDAQVDPIGTGNYPFINTRIHFKVAAYNGDGESAGADVSARDVQPAVPLGSSPYFSNLVPFAGGFPAQPVYNHFIFPAIPLSEHNRLYIIFNEPIDPSSAATATYALDGGLTVTSAAYMTSGAGGAGIPFGAIQIVANGNLNGRTLTVSNVKDLSGNPCTSINFGPFTVN